MTDDSIYSGPVVEPELWEAAKGSMRPSEAPGDPRIVAMELRGYRGWRVILTEEAVTLQSLRPRYRQAWTPGVQPVAVHTAVHADPWSVLPETLENDESPPVPHPKCLCGYNAYYRPDIERPALMAGADLRVAGVIRASGVVEMHEAGFRAQYAEILAIAPPRSTQNGGSDKTQEIIIKPSLLKVIADYYNVPWFETWDELVKNFPPTHDVEKAPDRRKEKHSPEIGEPIRRIEVQPIPAPGGGPCAGADNGAQPGTGAGEGAPFGVRPPRTTRY